MKLEEIKNKTQEATDYLVHSLEAGHSEVLTEYLGAMAKFHTYSFGNIMLMARQNASLFRSTLCCSLNNLSDFRWPPKYLKSRERRANRGWKSWVQNRCNVLHGRIEPDIVTVFIQDDWRQSVAAAHGQIVVDRLLLYRLVCSDPLVGYAGGIQTFESSPGEKLRKPSFSLQSKSAAPS